MDTTPLLLSSVLSYLSTQKDTHSSNPNASASFQHASAWLQNAVSSLQIPIVQDESAPKLEHIFNLGVKEYELSKYMARLEQDGFFDEAVGNQRLALEAKAKERFNSCFSSSVPVTTPSPLPSTPRRPSTSEAVKLKEEGNALFSEGRFPEALEKYNQACELDQNAIYFSNAAACHSHLDQHIEALQKADRAIQLDSSYYKAHYRRGVALAKLGRIEEARASLNQCIDLNPDFEPAHKHLNSLPAPTAPPQAPPQAPSVQIPANVPGLGGMIGQVMSDPNFMNMAQQMASQMMGGRSSEGDEDQSGGQPNCPQQ
ncbi:hypothetical protein GEMRC1_012005 [Eukaryota sp. GEM-RC1]